MFSGLDLFFGILTGFSAGVGIMAHLRDMERDALDNAKLDEIRRVTDAAQDWAEAVRRHGPQQERDA